MGISSCSSKRSCSCTDVSAVSIWCSRPDRWSIEAPKKRIMLVEERKQPNIALQRFARSCLKAARVCFGCCVQHELIPMSRSPRIPTDNVMEKKKILRIAFALPVQYT